MRITGHRTDSMERRYNIVDTDDIRSAKDLMERRTADVTAGKNRRLSAHPLVREHRGFDDKLPEGAGFEH